jgi:hypothetical protein
LLSLGIPISCHKMCEPLPQSARNMLTKCPVACLSF